MKKPRSQKEREEMSEKSRVLDEVREVVEGAQREFRGRLERLERSEGGMTQERYVRYLSMQYHLTNGVQRHFMTCASHPDMARRPKLREFLFHFAVEEELHFKVAEKDLSQLGAQPLPACLDVRLWWAFFNTMVTERPFVRLGATCILENLSGGAREVADRLFARADYLNPRNTKFMQIHRHGDELPHGDQILEALEGAHLEPSHVADLLEGARIGRVLYFRMAEWALTGQEAVHVAVDPGRRAA